MTDLTIGIACYIKNNPQEQMRFTKRCVDSIRKFVKADYNLVLVDNGSNDDGANFLRELNPEYIIRFSQNTGTSHAFNSIVNLSNTRYVYIPNNDHVVCENSIEGMINLLETNKEYSIVGLTDSEWATKDGLHQHRGDFNNLLNDNDFDFDVWNIAALNFSNKQETDIKDLFVGSNYLFTKDTWENFGKFRIGFNRPWVAVDAFLHEDLIKNNIKFCQYMRGLLYHPTGGQGTSKYIDSSIEEWRLKYLKHMNANIK